MSQLTTILQAVMAAQAQPSANNGSTGGPKTARKGARQWTTNDNDLPNGQRSKRRYPTSTAYCFSCGYDLPPKHTSKTCKWKKDGHNGETAITNKMGGSERNCFRYK
jgi:hypothetical protein